MVALPEVPSGRRPGGDPPPMSPGAAARRFHTSSARLWHSPCGVPVGAGVPSCQHHAPPRGREGSHSPIPCKKEQGVRANAARSGVRGLLPNQSGHIWDHLVFIPAAVEMHRFFFLNNCIKDAKKILKVIWLQADHKPSLLNRILYPF